MELRPSYAQTISCSGTLILLWLAFPKQRLVARDGAPRAVEELGGLAVRATVGLHLGVYRVALATTGGVTRTAPCPSWIVYSIGTR